MEAYIIYALIAMTAAGLYSFGIKVIAERNYNTSLFVIYSYAFGAIISGVYFLFFSETAVNNIFLILLFSFLNSFFYFLSTITRIKGLQYIDTVIFLPIYKTIAPILVTLISLFYFLEPLSTKEGIGIIIGILAPLLLITTTESKIQKNLKSGLWFVVLTSIFGTLVFFAGKQVTAHNLNIELFVCFSFIFGSFSALFNYNFLQKNKLKKKYKKKGIIKISLILAIIHFISFLFAIKALIGNLAIVFTINSFSILIPIILSIIFYKEHFNFRKALAVLASVLAGIFFIK